MEPTTRRLVGGALFASELSHNKSTDIAYSTLSEPTRALPKHMGSARLFIKEEIRPVARTFVSIMNFTFKSVRR
jgi:hypothetical protein